jgi:hypothetical protein
VKIRCQSQRGSWRTVNANLEEISTRHASVLTNSRIRKNSHVRILCRDRELAGRVCHTTTLPLLGHCVGIQFEGSCSWSPDIFMPQHLFAANRLLEVEQSNDNQPPCSCCMAACPVLPSRTQAKLEQEEPLSLTRAVADACPTLTDTQLSNCFKRLFRGKSEAFQFFRREYVHSSRG